MLHVQHKRRRHNSVRRSAAELFESSSREHAGGYAVGTVKPVVAQKEEFGPPRKAEQDTLIPIGEAAAGVVRELEQMRNERARNG